MRAIVIEQPGKFSVQTVPDPIPGPGEVLIKVGACGISRRLRTVRDLQP
jgi:NADPH:quinone reductase-like Zn-dependent oxidoreductase